MSLALIGAAALAPVVALGVLWWLRRDDVRLAVDVAKHAATDTRLPRWLRVVLGVGLAAKALPVDGGVDELALGIVAVALLTRYRPVLRSLTEEARERRAELCDPAPTGAGR